MKRTKEQDEKNRRSVAVYPTPDGEGDMAHAIPVWTQPVDEGSNWDEVRIGYSCFAFSLMTIISQVVLPVVARKKGLDDQYEMQDGSPKPAKVRETVPEPVCGISISFLCLRLQP